jgi:pyruvate,orthophosphate dikinase
MTEIDSPLLMALQYLRFKGRADLDALVTACGLDVTPLELVAAVEPGTFVASERDSFVSLGAQGRAHASDLLERERAATDLVALSAFYEGAFRPMNHDLKTIVTAWQVRPDGSINAHDDLAYDADVVDRVVALHRRFVDADGALQRAAPRLGAYTARLAAAVDRLRRGESMFLAGPLIDSFHTVWFELHQELIDLLSIDRLSEEAEDVHAV